MSPRFIQFAITLIASLVALAHTYAPDLTIDGTTVSLLAIAVLPWLAPLFKAIELPGGVKIEFQDLVKAEAKVKEAGLLSSTSLIEKTDRHIYAFEAVAGDDPNLALAGLRIELESKLNEIAKARNIKITRKGIRPLIHQLLENSVLNHGEVSALEDLLPLLNSAAHGASLDNRAAKWAMDIGPPLLSTLDEKIGERTIPQLILQWQNSDGSMVAESGNALSKALITSPKAFLKSMNQNQVNFTNWLEKLGHHSFTLFESRSEVEDDLYTAYYEKKRELILKAVKPFLNSEYDEEAKRIHNAVSTVVIRRIW